MSKYNNTIESKAGLDELRIAEFITKMSKKHEVNPDKIMIGFPFTNKTELYVWEWKVGVGVNDQFKTLEIIYLK